MEKNKVNGSSSLKMEMSIPLNYMKMISEIVSGLKKEKERISTINSGIWIHSYQNTLIYTTPMAS